MREKLLFDPLNYSDCELLQLSVCDHGARNKQMYSKTERCGKFSKSRRESHS